MPTPFAYGCPPALDGIEPVAIMDADCALCSFGARMIHRLDRSGTIRICPIQTARGQAALQYFGMDPSDPDSWLFLADGAAWSDFDAIVEVGRRCGGWGRLLAALMILPGPIRAWLYARIARNRYAIFGRGDICGLPDPGLRARLLL
ncbi:DCC1-like thiol-disulfide oxidoreductase family protein [Fontisubflavum oceani]|uniref:thiol-disulfide oxidoreductase DCC family protein n=1 Tax=Fontisubflavum oceani TaxID=2978973 RepID=UPI0025B5955F|nr:DCC1-like thiol-disulfide oxidoreductase family protein [Fontisubflavum oceani]WJY20318.1 DCC1-like thiol-disulfide oxidoreductase family protein [Fontisubflavum oceani]